ncbi:MAG: stage V sporulation protein AE [Clostridia bacterium]|nr:stage V sporulation protein AE [Clostridia bacterium]
MNEFLLTLIKAFIVGGALCAIAQIFIDKTALTPARILVAYVTVGVILTAVGLYEPLVKFAGCGATVPLTGFGYTLAKGVEKGVRQNGLIGALTGGLTGAAGGIAAAISFGYFFAVIFKGRPKN